LATKTYGTLLTTTTKPVATAKKTALGIGSKTIITGTRLSENAVGPAYAPLLRKVKLAATNLPVGDTLTFVERGQGAAQSILSLPVPADGKLDTEFAFLPGVNGGPQRSVDAYITSPAGIPRGVVHDIDTFKATAPPQPKAPRISSMKPVGSKGLQVTVKDEPAYGLKSSMPVMQLVVNRPNGGVDVIRLVGTDFRKQGKVWVATAKTGGTPQGARVKLASVSAGGKLAKGAGRKKTITVRRK
ncbi:MAG: hypothetical protein Q7T99_02900, partial [Pseudomonas sp.]|nr:hypothetical protein [Pseudomonas sp.]